MVIPPGDFDPLHPFLPEGSLKRVNEVFSPHHVQIKVSKPRSSKLGDHRPPVRGKYPFHRISINRDLKPYSFLITLIHELAHLRTWEGHGRRVKAHGKEWKSDYKDLLFPFVRHRIFPAPLVPAVESHLERPKASSCTDEELMRALRSFEGGKENNFFLEELPYGTVFLLNGKRRFLKQDQLRKRYRCKDLSNGKTYLVHPMAEVFPETPGLFAEM